MKTQIRNFLLFGTLFLFCVSLSACGLKARVYPEDRARVDQELPPGSPEANDPSREKTRRVYSLEVTKETKSTAASEKVLESSQPAAPAVVEEAPGATQNFAPVFTPPIALPTEYTIQKDDTMQKISKKFYGSFGKWTKIYDANKTKINDPNNIKSGITITIPKE